MRTNVSSASIYVLNFISHASSLNNMQHKNLVFQGCFLIDNGDIRSYQFA